MSAEKNKKQKTMVLDRARKMYLHEDRLEVSVARACRANSKVGSSFTSAIKKGLE